MQRRKKALENIKDAIEAYLETKEQIERDAEAYFVRSRVKMPKLSGINHKRAVKAFQKLV